MTTSASHRARARKRAACAATGHDAARIRIIDGREWCTFCRWWVGTPINTGTPPVTLLPEAVSIDA